MAAAPEPAQGPSSAPEQRSYWQIVLRQYRRNRRAVWGLRVVAFLILVAIFAPLIANEKPLVFHGYRYRLYVNTYDSLVYAHGDLAGLGREGRPLVLPELYPEGIVLPGIQQEFQEDMQRWEAGNPTWRMIRDLAFGPAQGPMNATRAALEDYLDDLRQDSQWARGQRDVEWLRAQKLPQDLQAELERVVELTRQNVPVAYEAKTLLRKDAVLQQLRVMRGEVGRGTRQEIDRFVGEYRQIDPSSFYRASPEELAQYDALVAEMRNLLDPEVVSFSSHTDFPALRNLTALDMLFMLSVLLWVTRGAWSRPLGWYRDGAVDRVRKQLVTCLAVPALAAVSWAAFVPEVNDTTDYKEGVRDGSLAVSWQIVAPIRFGVNQNDTAAKYQAPWWWERLSRKPEPAEVGAPAPDFSLDDLGGRERSPADLAAAGKVVVLEWFDPARTATDERRAQNVALSQLAKELQAQGVVWLALTSEREGWNRERYRQALSDAGLDLPLVVGSEERLGTQYGGGLSPQRFVIAPDGHVVFAGPLDDPLQADPAYLKRLTAAVAAGEPVPPAVEAESELERDLARLAARLESLERQMAEPEAGPWDSFLAFLTRHHMGTDGTGRDLMTRMIWGSRISLSIGFVAVGIYVFIGIVLGSLAGYFGGWVDIAISRAIEVVICFPTFFLILTVVAFLDPSVFNIMIVIGLTGWTGVARLIRGEFLRLRGQDFVIAGRALGFSDVRIIFGHLLPNALAPVLVAATFGVASAILIESSLSFLGFGVKVPTPTWGSVLSSARESWVYWWLTMFPGFAIFLTVTMYNLVGEGVRDAVDPKLRQ